jgi:hypothetical protein
LPRTASFNPPTAFCTLPAALSALLAIAVRTALSESFCRPDGRVQAGLDAIGESARAIRSQQQAT